MVSTLTMMMKMIMMMFMLIECFVLISLEVIRKKCLMLNVIFFIL